MEQPDFFLTHIYCNKNKFNMNINGRFVPSHFWTDWHLGRSKRGRLGRSDCILIGSVVYSSYAKQQSFRPVFYPICTMYTLVLRFLARPYAHYGDQNWQTILRVVKTQ